MTTKTAMASKTNVAAFVTTNVHKHSMNEGFLNMLSLHLAKVFHTTEEQITLEFQTEVVMIRAASTAPMLNVRLFHNSDLVNNLSKQQKAEELADWLARQMKIPTTRVLVLFMDTRLCCDTFQ